MGMRKSVTLLVLAFLTASCLVGAQPASGAAVAENSWSSKAPLQEARGSLGVAVANGKIYAIGGSNGSFPNGTSIFVGTNEEYDPTTDAWTFKKPMPTPRIYFPIVTLQNKIYCIGGFLNNGSMTGINEVYDPATDTWETKAAMPTARVALKANAANGKIYLIGGYVYADNTNYHISTLSINEVYDPETDSWTTKSPSPYPTSSYASAVVDDRIYLFGGLFDGSISKSSTFVYDAITDTWNQGAAPPSYISYGMAAATTGVNAPKKIYVFAEDFESSKRPIRIHVYDPKLDSWTEGATLPTGRSEFGVAIARDLIYVIGGSETIYNSTIPFDWSSSYILNYATNEQYTPFGYRTPNPSPATLLEKTAPIIAFVSLENKTYDANSVPLTFTVNEPVTEIAYSLDGAANVTIVGNSTLYGLTVGLHNVTVYAWDAAGKVGCSETLTFIVAAPEPFPVVPVAAASIVVAVALGAGLLLLRRKHRREAAAA